MKDSAPGKEQSAWRQSHGHFRERLFRGEMWPTSEFDAHRAVHRLRFRRLGIESKLDIRPALCHDVIDVREQVDHARRSPGEKGEDPTANFSTPGTGRPKERERVCWCCEIFMMTPSSWTNSTTSVCSNGLRETRRPAAHPQLLATHSNLIGHG